MGDRKKIDPEPGSDIWGSMAPPGHMPGPTVGGEIQVGCWCYQQESPRNGEDASPATNLTDITPWARIERLNTNLS